jgi:hypothetical protein
MGRQEFDIRIIFFVTLFWTHPDSCPMSTRSSFSEAKAAEIPTSPTSCVEVKKAWIFNFTHPSAFIAWCNGVEECSSAHLRDLSHSMGTFPFMQIHVSLCCPVSSCYSLGQACPTRCPSWRPILLRRL